MEQILVQRLHISPDFDLFFGQIYVGADTEEKLIKANRRLRTICYGQVRLLLGGEASHKGESRRLVLTPQIDRNLDWFYQEMINDEAEPGYNREVLDACVAFVMRRVGSTPTFLGDGIAAVIVEMLELALPQGSPEEQE